MYIYIFKAAYRIKLVGPNMDKNLSLGCYVEQIFKKSYELFLELLIKINSN